LQEITYQKRIDEAELVEEYTHEPPFLGKLLKIPQFQNCQLVNHDVTKLPPDFFQRHQPIETALDMLKIFDEHELDDKMSTTDQFKEEGKKEPNLFEKMENNQVYNFGDIKAEVLKLEASQSQSRNLTEMKEERDRLTSQCSALKRKLSQLEADINSATTSALEVLMISPKKVKLAKDIKDAMVTKPHAIRKTYSNDVKLMALQLVKEIGTFEASEATRIPYNTLAKWNEDDLTQEQTVKRGRKV